MKRPADRLFHLHSQRALGVRRYSEGVARSTGGIATLVLTRGYIRLAAGTVPPA
jgi:hypothetical protein